MALVKIWMFRNAPPIAIAFFFEVNFAMLFICYRLFFFQMSVLAHNIVVKSLFAGLIMWF